MSLACHAVAICCLAYLANRVAFTSLFGVTRGDELHIWHAKALWLWWQSVGQDQGAALTPDPLSYTHHGDYPLLNPLLQVWAWGWMEGVAPLSGRLVVTAVWIAGIVMVIGRALRERSLTGLLLTLTLLSTRWFNVLPGDSDLLVAIGLVLSAGPLLRRPWFASRRMNHMAAAVGGLILVMAKNEGVMLLGCVILAPLARSMVGTDRSWTARIRKVGGSILPFLPACVITVAWVAWNRAHHFENEILTGTASSPHGLAWRLAAAAGSRWLSVGRHVVTDVLIGWEETGLLLTIAIVAATCFGTLFGARRVLPGLVLIVSALAGYALVFVGSPHDLEWHWSTAGPRVCSQLLPFCVVWTTEILGARAWSSRQRPGSRAGT